MGWSTTVVSPPDGNMKDYFLSLEKMLSRNDQFYVPAHGNIIKNPKRFVKALIGHRKMRDKIKLVSSAGTGHYYTTSKNKKTTPDKMEIKKFDPVVRKHVIYKEAKIK